MQAHAEAFSVERMAKLLGVSRSGYYSYINRTPSKRSQHDQQLLEKINMIHKENRQVYGSPRIHAALRHQSIRCGRKRVARLMRENGIVSKMTKRFRVTTKRNKRHPVAENILQQDFCANRPNEKWVSDITAVHTREGWLYVAAIIDLYSRVVVGISMSARMTRQLVINAFNQAIVHRGNPREFIYHSDKGSQYTSGDFQALLKLQKIVVSMSGTGNCYDNAAMESFFHTLKTESVYFEDYVTREEAENHIFDYVETFYNPKRLHSYLGYQSPKTFEQQFYNTSVSN